jgi:hypothetical protein
MVHMGFKDQKNREVRAYALAKLFRVITVPPIMVAAFLSIVYFSDDVFPSGGDYLLALTFLAILPALAYPVQKLIPRLNAGGRRAQRNLAFVFSFVGYIGAAVASVVRGAVPNLLYISVVYLLSLVLLTLINCLTPWHASGHGCSLMGPVVLTCLFVGWYAIPAGLLLYAASLWASLYMKRHTLQEFLLGSAVSVFSALVCYVIIHPMF